MIFCMTFLKNSSKQEEQFLLRREKQERSLVLIYFSKIPAHDLAEQKAEQHCVPIRLTPYPQHVGCCHSPEYNPALVGAVVPPAIPRSDRKALNG